jgi:C-terminal processing protease CtpA/Prc
VPQPLIAGGYRLRLSTQHPHQGESSAELYSDPVAWTQLPGMGSMVQELDAVPLRDQTLRLSGWIRTEGGGAGQLWLQVDDPSKPGGIFSRAPEEAIELPEWTWFELVGSIAMDAVGIHFGANLVGQGSLFLDDVHLDIVESIGHEPAAPISDRGMDHLVAAGRLLDVLRFFHPSDSCASAPWDRVSVALVAAAESAGDARELADALTRIAEPLAPSVTIFPTGDERARERKQREVAERLQGHRPVGLIHWNHYGVGHRDVGFPERESVYRSWRGVVEGADLSAYPKMPTVEFDLGSGVSAIIPTAVYIDETHRSLPPAKNAQTDGSAVSEPGSTAPSGSMPGAGASGASVPAGTSLRNHVPGKPDGFRVSANDRTTRLAAVLYAWSILREFYPNFDLGSCPESETWLREALSEAALDPDRDAFLSTLRTMLSCLGDGHAEAHAFYPERPGQLPLRWRWVEDRLVITEVATLASFDPSESVRQGDVVVAIGGRPTEGLLDSLGAYISSPTERWRRYRASERLATGAIGSTLRLTVDRSGKRHEATLPMLPAVEVEAAFPSTQSEPIRSLEEGIHYVDLSRLHDDALAQFLSQSANADAIIFDLRGDPDDVGPQFLGHWVDSLVLSPEWRVPLRHGPGTAAWIRSDSPLEPEVRSTRWALDPIAPRTRARIAMLMDERSISRAETFLAVAQRGLGAVLVGGPSAGTLGNANRARLPGGFRITWTGMDVYQGAESPTMPNPRLSGIGIAPDILVSPTIEAIRAGRDEVLEAAIEAVKR